MELVALELRLEAREGIQADVSVYKGLKAGNCRCRRQLRLGQSGAEGRGMAGAACFPLGAFGGPESRL